MTGVQKAFGLLIGLAMVTTLILPGRKTPQVINAVTDLVRKPLATAMGTGKRV
jgi:hypothetical protein